MALLLNGQSLSKSFGPRPLFQNVSLALAEGERLGLIGPNGAGKSTLLKILAGRETPDAGTLTCRQGLRVAYVAQADVFPPGNEVTPLSVVAAALAEDGAPARAEDPDHDAHERETRAAVLLGRVGFRRFDQPVADLSGGWRKRLAIARELARAPDLLLLDEPTNHLDLPGILWLEELLEEAPFAAVVVTHDRYFLEEATTRILELSGAYPEGTFAVDGPYSEFLERRAEFLAAQAHQEQALAGKVRQDIAWLRRGAKARRTKAKGRIQAAGQRIEALAELQQRNVPARAAALGFQATGRRTRNLLVVKGLTKALGGRTLFARLDLTLAPGMCLGLLGPNGSGKTTLLQVLTGDLAPDAGTVQPAPNLRVVTFTQRRAELDRRQTLRAALCPVGDTVFYQDRALHVTTWARRFLFQPEQLNVPVGDLSGGEQARILIAGLMHQPADLLLLDEPTNDLDIPTLEVLEESLAEFPGAVVLVTHDRFLLDRLCTQVLGLDGRGGAKLLATYGQWAAAQAAEPVAAIPRAPAAPRSAAPPSVPAPTGRPKRLAYHEQREWDQMEARIQAAEARVAQLERAMQNPALLADHQELAGHCRRLEAGQAEVAALYARWAELEARQQ